MSLADLATPRSTHGVPLARSDDGAVEPSAPAASKDPIGVRAAAPAIDWAIVPRHARDFAVTPPTRHTRADADRKHSASAWPGPLIKDQVRETQIKLGTHCDDEGLCNKIIIPDAVAPATTAPDSGAAAPGESAPDANLLHARHMEALLVWLATCVGVAWRAFDPNRDAEEYAAGRERMQEALAADAGRPRTLSFTEAPPRAWRALRKTVFIAQPWGSAEAIGVLRGLLDAMVETRPADRIAAALARLVAAVPRDDSGTEPMFLMQSAALLITVAWSVHSVEPDPAYRKQHLRRFIDQLVLAWMRRPRIAMHRADLALRDRKDGKGGMADMEGAGEGAGSSSLVARLAEYVHGRGAQPASGPPPDPLRPMFLYLLKTMHQPAFFVPPQSEPDAA